MNIHSIYQFFMKRFRPARIRRLKQQCAEIDGSGAILDVGGTQGWWAMVEPRNRNITIVNLDARHAQAVERAGYKFEVVDGRTLPYADGAFDLVFSNSVIEHVGTWEQQQRFAAEMLRVGRRIYLQTPNKWFPVEPHLIAVFLHWLPSAIQIPLVRWFSVWGWVTKPTRQRAAEFVEGTRLLSRGDLQRLFPGCRIEKESVLGLAKSYIVLKP